MARHVRALTGVSGRRFGLLVALVAAVVGLASFLGGVAILDDDAPDDPPAAVRDLDGDGTTSSSTTAPSGGEDGLATPTWVAIVSSEPDEAAAGAVADDLSEAGFPAGVLRSDDHGSLAPGFWVAYTGPYPDRAGADAAVAALAERGIDGAYPRCVGTNDECAGRGDDDGGGEDDDDDG